MTEQFLRDLYLDQHKTETEIGRVFGISQAHVSRLRQKYGIPTLTKSDRFGLPDTLTDRLRSILVGSMLGDGNLRRSGTNTARYQEHHSVKQHEYLLWKAEEWGVFTVAIRKADKGEYLGHRLFTHACRALFPYWQLFYPSGSGPKTFTRLPVEWVDGLALAVWFMDDGSRSGNYVRITVGPSLEDQRVQVGILTSLGIRSKVYEDGSLHIQGRTALNRFLDLVRPHLHPSLGYKIAVKTPKAGLAPRDLLTYDRLRSLFDRGLHTDDIADVLQVSRTSVSRWRKQHGLAPGCTGRPSRSSKVELDVETASLAIKRLDARTLTYVESVVAVLSRTVLPLVVPSMEEAEIDWSKLLLSKTELVEDRLVRETRSGSKLCQRFFPHRYDARYQDRPSVRSAWYDQEYVRRAVKFQLAVGDPVQPVRVFRALQAVVRGPTNFRPCFAKALVEALCPVGGTVLDPCAGYGGRAVGTLASGRRYVGVDPHPKAGASYTALQSVVGHFDFFEYPFEDVDLADLRADLVLTSPPYFSVEKYSDSAAQSWVRYSTWDLWLEGFLQPFVLKSKRHLRDGGLFCVNTKNVRRGAQRFPIADELVRLAGLAGFRLQRTLVLPLGRIGKVPATEQVFVFV